MYLHFDTVSRVNYVNIATSSIVNTPCSQLDKGLTRENTASLPDTPFLIFMRDVEGTPLFPALRAQSRGSPPLSGSAEMSNATRSHDLQQRIYDALRIGISNSTKI